MKTIEQLIFLFIIINKIILNKTNDMISLEYFNTTLINENISTDLKTFENDYLKNSNITLFFSSTSNENFSAFESTLFSNINEQSTIVSKTSYSKNTIESTSPIYSTEYIQESTTFYNYSKDTNVMTANNQDLIVFSTNSNEDTNIVSTNQDTTDLTTKIQNSNTLYQDLTTSSQILSSATFEISYIISSINSSLLLNTDRTILNQDQNAFQNSTTADLTSISISQEPTSDILINFETTKFFTNLLNNDNSTKIYSTGNSYLTYFI